MHNQLYYRKSIDNIQLFSESRGVFRSSTWTNNRNILYILELVFGTMMKRKKIIFHWLILRWTWWNEMKEGKFTDLIGSLKHDFINTSRWLKTIFWIFLCFLVLMLHLDVHCLLLIVVYEPIEYMAFCCFWRSWIALTLFKTFFHLSVVKLKWDIVFGSLFKNNNSWWKMTIWLSNLRNCLSEDKILNVTKWALMKTLASLPSW